MFTPQKKGWTGWSPSPLRANPRSGAAAAVSALGKGKAVADGPPPPPPVASLGENGLDSAGLGGDDLEVWRRFREAGLLDEASLEKKGREALAKRVTDLEKELHDYQYNMGLLLIEKKEWAAAYEEIRQALAEKDEILKREQAAHLTAISEYEKQGESLRKALGVEKQCVADLEKSLREMRSEMAEVRFTSEKKFTDARSLEVSLEEKSLEIAGKLHAADAKLAEASRKKSQADRELEEIVARERRFEKEKLSFETERKSREKQLKDQEAFLEGWEKNLKESQNRLSDLQRSVNDREERANENDRIFKMRQEELEEIKNIIESKQIGLKKTEEDINKRLQNLCLNEKAVESKLMSLEKKEKELANQEEKLKARETAGLQKLLDDHKAELESRRQDLELELERKRETIDEEMKHKLADLAEREKDIKLWQDQFSNKEQALDSRMQKLKDLENDLDTKSKALKKWEESLKNDKNKVLQDMEQVNRERKDVENSRSDLESIKAAIESEKKQILEEKENLKLTKEEREEHGKKTAQLKQEIEEYMMRSNSLSAEIEDLRQQRQKFEKQWEALDEKRIALEAEGKKLNEERARFDRWRDSEEKRLKNMELELEAKNRKELEDLELKKEAFRNEMLLQRSEYEELLKRERADITRNLQLYKHELDIETEKKQANKERELEQKENELNEKLDFVENKIKYAIDLNESKIQKIIVEKEQLQRDMEALSEDRQKVETDKVEIRKDIDSLKMLSENLKDRREQYNKDMSRLISLAEKYRVCKNCGITVFDELDILGFQDSGNIQEPSLTFEKQYESQNTESLPQGTESLISSGGRMSLLQKCSRFFKFSPSKRAEQSSEHEAGKNISFGARLDRAASEGPADYEPTPVYGVHAQELPSDVGARENEEARRYDRAPPVYGVHAQELPSDDGARENEEAGRYDRADETEFSFGVADNSVDILRTQSGDDTQDMVGDRNVPFLDENGREESSARPDNYLQTETSKQGRRTNRKARPKGVRRTRSVRAVVEDAKTILGETFEGKNDGPLNVESKDFPSIQEDSQGDSVAMSAGQKRRFAHLSGVTTSEHDAEDSEARSDSISVGGQRRKRRQTSGPVAQTAGEKRYNFRRTTIANAAAAAQTASDKTKGLKAGSRQKVTTSGDDGEGTSKAEEPLGESKGTSDLLQKSAVVGVVEVHEFSQKIVQVEAGEAQAPAESSNEEDEEEGEVADGKAAAQDIGPSTPSDSGFGAEQDDEDDEDCDRQNLSIGKKLWTFFTT